MLTAQFFQLRFANAQVLRSDRLRYFEMFRYLLEVEEFFGFFLQRY
jgi:hypothetical protein